MKPKAKKTAKPAPESKALAKWGVDAAPSLTFDSLKGQAQKVGSTLSEAALLNRGNNGKDKLVGKPFVITGVTVRPGKFGDPIARIAIVTEDDRRAVMHDGSTGIFRQLVDPESGDLMVALPLFVPGGLRVSEYDHPEHGPARTFYLSGEQAL